MGEYVTKDSGRRVEYASGMVRDSDEGKPRFDLCLAPGVPFPEQMLTRWAALMERGARKYGEHNWTQANSDVELRRMRASAMRHLMQYMAGERDEDHAAAVMANLMMAEATEWKLAQAARPQCGPCPYEGGCAVECEAF